MIHIVAILSPYLLSNFRRAADAAPILIHSPTSSIRKTKQQQPCQTQSPRPPTLKNKPSPMKTEEQPLAKQIRKDNDERVVRAARLLIQSPILNVPQVMLCNDYT